MVESSLKGTDTRYFEYKFAWSAERGWSELWGDGETCLGLCGIKIGANAWTNCRFMCLMFRTMKYFVKFYQLYNMWRRWWKLNVAPLSSAKAVVINNKWRSILLSQTDGIQTTKLYFCFISFGFLCYDYAMVHEYYLWSNGPGLRLKLNIDCFKIEPLTKCSSMRLIPQITVQMFLIYYWILLIFPWVSIYFCELKSARGSHFWHVIILMKMYCKLTVYHRTARQQIKLEVWFYRIISILSQKCLPLIWADESIHCDKGWREGMGSLLFFVLSNFKRFASITKSFQIKYYQKTKLNGCYN